MSKQAITGWMHAPLGAILGTRAKVAVLRTVWRALTPLHYREIVRRSGMAYAGIDLAIHDLLATGVVLAVPGGRDRRVQWNASHRLAPLIAGMLQGDADFFPALRVALRTAVQSCADQGLMSAAMVGSVARRIERLEHTVELVMIARDDEAVARCSERLGAAIESITGRFGVRITPLCYSRERAQRLWKTRTAQAEEAVAEAEEIWGIPLGEVLRQES